MKNSFFNSFVPKQPNFFCLLKQLADILSEAADVLTESVEQGKPEERETYYRRVKEVERRGDMVTHQVLDELETTFITPLDREDINALASGIDDVIDCVNSCAKRINIYNPRVLGDSARELCHFIQQEAACICKAVEELNVFRKNPARLRGLCVELHDLENQADDVYEFFIRRLFEEEKDSIELIKIKEIMQELERTTDAAEHVGKILKNLIVKYV